MEVSPGTTDGEITFICKLLGPCCRSNQNIGLCGFYQYLHDLISCQTLLCCVCRADAQAGVRKQGCKSLTQAYCMVRMVVKNSLTAGLY